jgi:hypothetical protein
MKVPYKLMSLYNKVKLTYIIIHVTSIIKFVSTISSISNNRIGVPTYIFKNVNMKILPRKYTERYIKIWIMNKPRQNVFIESDGLQLKL